MARIKCKQCGKAIGYYKDTNIHDYGFKRTEIVWTHATTTKEVVYPNAKLDKYKYGLVTRCNHCGEVHKN